MGHQLGTSIRGVSALEAEGSLGVRPPSERSLGTDPAVGGQRVTTGRGGPDLGTPLLDHMQGLAFRTLQKRGLGLGVDEGSMGDLGHLGARQGAGTQRLLGRGQQRKTLPGLQGALGLAG